MQSAADENKCENDACKNIAARRQLATNLNKLMVRPTPASIKQPSSDEEPFASQGYHETATDKQLGGESQSGWQTGRYMTSRGTDRQTNRQTD